MTRKELSQLYYLNKLRKEAELELDRLIQLRGAKPVVLDDMPHAQGGNSSPTETMAIQITEQIEIVKGLTISCQQKEKEIWRYIEELEKTDAYLATLVKYRCIDRKSWEQVALKLNTTSEACRKYYNRKIA